MGEGGTQPDRQMLTLGENELDGAISIGDDGSIDVDTDVLARLISRAVGLLGIRVGVASVDYLQHEDGAPELATRSASGIWWHSHGDDTAMIGGFLIDGLAMTVTTEGEGESPVAESVGVIDRATKAIATQHEGAEVVDSGLIEVPRPTEAQRARVVVTRDYRVRRPQDLLKTDELREYQLNRFGIVIVQLIGGDKALVIKHGI